MKDFTHFCFNDQGYNALSIYCWFTKQIPYQGEESIFPLIGVSIFFTRPAAGAVVPELLQLRPGG